MISTHPVLENRLVVFLPETVRRQQRHPFYDFVYVPFNRLSFGFDCYESGLPVVSEESLALN